ncbi:MAG: oxygenase MpaB family protein, partial [Halobacteriales archaeon]
MATASGGSAPGFSEAVPDDLPRDVDEVVRDVDPAAGVHGPGSTSWHVNRENALFLAGPTAALLQVAHPKVAAGVDEHSDYEVDPVGRFQRTFEVVDDV